MDRLAVLDVITNHLDDGAYLVKTVGNESVHTSLEALESLSHGSIEDNHGAGAVCLRTYGTELEAVTGECERRSTVAVSIVDEQLRNLRYVELHALLASHVEEFVLVRGLDVLENLRELMAEERRNDGWRCLVGAKTMGVGGTHDGSLEQAVVLIYSHKSLNDEYDEAEAVLRCLAGSVEQDAGVGGKTPVVVLARTVYACERLLMKQHAEAVATCHLLHERHEQHVMVNGNVHLLEDRSQLELVGRNLVVTGLAGNAKLESLNLKILHESLHALRDGAEIMVVHLLVLCRIVSHKRTACEHEVRTSRIESLVNEEILLLPTKV